MKTIHRSLATLLLLPLALGALAVALSGCSKKDDTPPANSGYYSGPKAAKTPPATGAKSGVEN